MKTNKYLLYGVCASLVWIFIYLITFKEETKAMVESEKNKTMKLPDAIIIGVSKCGINTI